MLGDEGLADYFHGIEAPVALEPNQKYLRKSARSDTFYDLE